MNIQNILNDVKEVLLFELWDINTKNKLKSFMDSCNIQYRADEELDVDNNLLIYLLEDGKEHKITISSRPI